MKTYVMESIAELPKSERPREKMLQSGKQALSDLELMAALLGSGNRRIGVHQLAAQIIRLMDRCNEPPSVESLLNIDGIGEAKAVVITSAFELARRFYHPGALKIRHPEDILPLLRHYVDRPQEHFFCVCLNGAHENMGIHTVSIGTINRTIVHPREVFSEALRVRAAAIVVAHNHPSGNLDISGEDREVTRRLIDAGKILGIQLLDHIVFSQTDFVSFLESGELDRLG